MNKEGLYDPHFESDACGIGFIANYKNKASHQIVLDALTILERMEHRGAVGYEKETGDGAGITTQIPHHFFQLECQKLGIHLPKHFLEYSVGSLFFPKSKTLVDKCKETFETIAKQLDLKVLGYRKVPTNNKHIGKTALKVEPEIWQVFISSDNKEIVANNDIFERKLFLLKNASQKATSQFLQNEEVDFYINSLSTRKIVYKGQLTSLQLRHYYPDLRDTNYHSPYGIVHSRFATNTFPSWKLAQPFRYIAHNGEINTLQGNLNWLNSNEKTMYSDYFTQEEMEMFLPVVPDGQSDSACLDNMIELLAISGRSLPHVMMMLIPEVWDTNKDMPQYKKDFYDFHASVIEPWDGPAAVCFCNGKILGATLDRNGLRPCRYTITKDDRVILSSESGVLPIDPCLVEKKGRLNAGTMFVVDFENQKIISDDELKQTICKQKPYGEWLKKYKISLSSLTDPKVRFTHMESEHIFKYQKIFGYTVEDINDIILKMAEQGKEPIGSMGLDIPLAIMSHHPQHLSYYFKQLFAQVTNPPIDPIRESSVMSLISYLGNAGNLLKEEQTNCHTLALQHPLLNNYQLEKIRSIDTGVFQAKTLQAYFNADGKVGSLERGVERLCRYAEDAANDHFEVLILSDRFIDSEHAPIPSLLACSAVHHHLIRKGLRGKVGIIMETADAWEVHHFACLIGYGATAINPYLALSTIRDEYEKSQSDRSREELKDEVQIAKDNYFDAINKGLLKIFSKMGISTLQSYQAAQIFEIIGINKDVVAKYFTNTVSRLEGLGLDELAKEVLAKHSSCYHNKAVNFNMLDTGGVYQWKRRGEKHLMNPQSIHYLQIACRKGDSKAFDTYSNIIDNQTIQQFTLRGLLDFNSDRAPIPLSEVESAEEIYKRFCTGAMSFGSISWEAHTTLAKAMNAIGGKSNTGEGGEDDIRYENDPNSEYNLNSAIKQIASGRFGVTSLYLANAQELQIKMAQGAKPGEGGQLPGHKVDDWIARVRHSTPGVGLISPPPHHDIYSIEDLAQLIFDLKNSNPTAQVSVKLVSKAGVGTIASGVAKAKSDIILISGQDGGTGASPISSIRHTGLPWELGIAETHQTLLKNKLRSRVIVQADGQLRTARDIIIATLLGAEQWGISTAALIVEGCILMRKCHENTCPVGIATQRKELRDRFTGKPEHVIQFFEFITQDIRKMMARLGFKTINEMVGRADVLKKTDKNLFWKSQLLDLNPLIQKYNFDDALLNYNSEKQPNVLEKVLDNKLYQQCKSAIENNQKIFYETDIENTDRTTGTMLSYYLTKVHGSEGMEEGSIHIKCNGTAGQSFGAFTNKGLFFEIEGDANDYFGKGMSGAKACIYPSRNATIDAEKNSIIGNVAFYGATAGEAYINGRAGERFCVRNSGVKVVVEGIGDHGCEYMTGGLVVNLGSVGKNFGAGMSGGIAYIYDFEDSFIPNCNMEMIDIDPILKADEKMIYNMIEQHHKLTKSKVAAFILQDFSDQVSKFKKVFPKEYKRVIQQQELQVKNVV